MLTWAAFDIYSALYPLPFAIHPSPSTPHPSPSTPHPPPLTLHPSPLTFHPSPFTLFLRPAIPYSVIVRTEGLSQILVIDSWCFLLIVPRSERFRSRLSSFNDRIEYLTFPDSFLEALVQMERNRNHCSMFVFLGKWYWSPSKVLLTILIWLTNVKATEPRRDLEEMWNGFRVYIAWC